MRKLKPQTRFLLRGSALLIGMLTLWWFVLLTPMLYGLEGLGGVFGRMVLGGRSGELIRENPSGDWTFRVPIERTIPAGPAQPIAQQIHSIDFDMPRADVIAFTFSIPVFWAVVLAAPNLRRNLVPLAQGTAIMIGLELILLVLFADISARKAADQLASGLPPGQVSWILRFGEYLVVSVLPYALPFVVALTVHRELRSQIFQWGSDPGVPQQPGTTRERPSKKDKRRRERSNS